MTSLVTIETNAADVSRWLMDKSRNLSAAMRDAMKETEREGLRMYRRTSNNWSNQPEYKVEREQGSNHITLVFGTSDKIWNWLDRGTRPHIIRPKRAKVLAFQWGGPGSYKAKTRPGWIGSGSGGPSGDTVFRRAVHHPGTEPRHWTAAIQGELDKKSVAIMLRHLERWRLK